MRKKGFLKLERCRRVFRTMVTTMQRDATTLNKGWPCSLYHHSQKMPMPRTYIFTNSTFRTTMLGTRNMSKDMTSILDRVRIWYPRLGVPRNISPEDARSARETRSSSKVYRSSGSSPSSTGQILGRSARLNFTNPAWIHLKIYRCHLCLVHLSQHQQWKPRHHQQPRSRKDAS